MFRRINGKTSSSSSSSETSSRRNSPNLSIPAKARIKRELSILNSDPPPGIATYLPSSDDMSKIQAEISGAEGSPFENGLFFVSVQITSRYPFEPPRCRFTTPIYHPNIDSHGRICLDTLKCPPAGSWSPAVSLPSLLLTLRTLMSNPNPDDGLVPEIADLYKRDPQKWRREAELRTRNDASSALRIAPAEKKLDDCNDENYDNTHSPLGNNRNSAHERISTVQPLKRSLTSNENTHCSIQDLSSNGGDAPSNKKSKHEKETFDR